MAKGRNILLQLKVNGVYTTVAGIRSTSLMVSQEPADVTDAESGDWRELQPNMLSQVELSGAGVFKDDVVVNLFEDYCFSGTTLEAKLVFENSNAIAGEFFVTSFDYTGETLDVQMYSISLAGSGSFSLYRPGTKNYTNGYILRDITSLLPLGSFTTLGTLAAMTYNETAFCWLLSCYGVSAGVVNGLYRSFDDGETWELLENVFGTGNYIYTLSTNGDGTIIASGGNDVILRSVDNGSTWVEVLAKTSWYMSASKYSNGVWIVTGFDNIFRSTDDGLTWVSVLSGFNAVVSNEVVTDGDGNWLAGTDNGNMVSSNNNGISWAQQSVGTFRGWGGVGFKAGKTPSQDLWLASGGWRAIVRSVGDPSGGWAILQDLVENKDYESMLYTAGIGWVTGGVKGIYEISLDEGINWSGKIELVPGSTVEETLLQGGNGKMLFFYVRGDSGNPSKLILFDEA